MTKKNNYISADLLWAEAQLDSWKKYIDANPIEKIKDRWGSRQMPKGGQASVCTATIEQQIKCIQDTMVKYLQLLEVIDKLREKEANKPKEARGGGTIPHRMKQKKKIDDEE